MTTEKTYDAMNQVTSESTVVNGQDEWTTTYSYDGSGDQTLVTSPDGTTTQTEYDSYGEPIAEVDACNTPRPWLMTGRAT